MSETQTSRRQTTMLQKVAVWSFIGCVIFGIAIASTFGMEANDTRIRLVAIGILISLLVHGLGMIWNAIRNKQVGWVIAMVVFGPFVSIPYYFLACDVNYPSDI